MKEQALAAFPALTTSKWEEIASKSLKGKDLESLVSSRFDGLDLPLWRSDSPEVEGMPPRAVAKPEAGMPWEIQQTCEGPADVLEALANGVQGLRLSASACESNGLEALLDGVYLEMVRLHLDGPEATGLLRGLMNLQKRRADALQQPLNPSGACTLDILRKDWWMTDGPARLDRHVASWGAAFPNFRTWGADASPWLAAGMDAADAMAWLLFGLHRQWTIWQSQNRGNQGPWHAVVLQWAVGSEVLVEAAGLRALRRVWSQFLASKGIADVPVWIDAMTNPIRFERWQPEDNLLRCTASGYAAVLGGADGVEILPHDVLAPEGMSARSRRWARNIQHLLIEESRLHATSDPLKGSRWVETATAQIAELAWRNYQDLIQHTDLASRPDGWLTERILAGRLHRLKEGMFRPSDAPAAHGRGMEAPQEVVWDELGRPLPWHLVDHLKTQEA